MDQYTMEISKMGKGKCIIMDGRPYRIIDIRNVVVSKHSHTKTKVDLEDVFTGSKITKTMPTHENFREVEIPRKKGQLIAKIEDKVHVMDTISYETFDAEIDKDLLKQLTEGDEITFVQFGGFSKVINKRD
jgi:translation elongation factor P/translation initiation factor 5A